MGGSETAKIAALTSLFRTAERTASAHAPQAVAPTDQNTATGPAGVNPSLFDPLIDAHILFGSDAAPPHSKGAAGQPVGGQTPPVGGGGANANPTTPPPAANSSSSSGGQVQAGVDGNTLNRLAALQGGPPAGSAGHQAMAPQHAATLTSGTFSNGSHFEDLVTDNPSGPGVSVSGNLTLTEGGPAGTVNVTLNTQPTDTVVVNVTAGPALSIPSGSSTLTFTPSNWSTPQPVSVSAVTDGVAEGYHSDVVQTTTSSSNDPDYNSINGSTAVVNILDADGPNAVDTVVGTNEGTAVPSITVLSNDSDPHGYSLSITGYTQGSGGAVALNSDQTFSYTPGSSYTGVDQFSYTIDNGHGQTTTGIVMVHVSPVNQAPTLQPIADMTNNEDANVTFQVQGNDLDGDQVYYTATGLPQGLGLDELTGQITGQIASNAANPVPFQPVASSHTYQVTIQAQDSFDHTVSTSFNWTVNHVNHAPFLEYPGALVAQANAPFGGQFVGHDADIMQGMAIDQLTYSLSGAPSDIHLNSNTGQFYAALLPADVGFYTPTVTVSDGHTTGSQTFDLTVLPFGTSAPSTQLQINNTADTSDDLVLVGASAPVAIQGSPNTTVNLTITGPATLSQSQVALDDSGQGPVTITPTGQSQSLDDILVKAFVLSQPTAQQPPPAPPPQGNPVEIDAKKLSAITITIPTINRTYDTYNTLPAGSKTHPLFRIPPKVDTSFLIDPSLDLSGSVHKITLTPGGIGDPNGTFTINGLASVTIQKTQLVRLRGVDMTAPGGNQGKLFVQAVVGTVTKKSNGFSVSAIPIKLRITEVGRNVNARPVAFPLTYANGLRKAETIAPYSLFAFYSWDSDSGPKSWADLDQVWIGEFVTWIDKAAKANWKGLKVDVPAGASYPKPSRGDLTYAVRGSFLDNFVIPGDQLPAKAPIVLRGQQWYGFRDGRSESVTPGDRTHDYQNDIAYFASTRSVVLDPDGKWYYTYDRQNADGQPEPSGLPFKLEVK